jgi:polysaccharide biosynthesis/export protein
MERPNVLALAGWLAAGTLTASCMSSEPVAPVASPSQTQAKPGEGNYIIGPGDTLEVFVWRNPDLSVTVPVRPDGKISTPLVEDMRDMEKVLSEYVRSPKVNIIVTNAASAFSLVKVVGQVQRPQALPYREGMTVLDAVLAVGGLTQFASGNRARIVRMENGRETVIHVKLANLVNGGDVEENVRLKPGDILVVPQTLF